MKRILVVGDAITDVYRECQFKKMCPDAPGVPAVVSGRSRVIPGGAANVALNVAALGTDCVVDLIAVIDMQMSHVLKSLSSGRIGLAWSAHHSPMLTKERMVVDGKITIRIDNLREAPSFWTKDVCSRIDGYLAENVPDVVILSDYGSLDVKRLIGSLEAVKGRVIIDTKETDMSLFSGCLMIKLNKDEFASIVETDHSPERHFRYLVVTMGEMGAKVFVRNGDDSRSITHSMVIPGIKTDVIDVCGCGDTFIAGLAVSMVKNGDPFLAARFGNAAASTVVSLPGAAVADLKRTLELVEGGR